MKRSLSFDEIYLNSKRGKYWTKKWLSEGMAKGLARGLARGEARGIAKGEARGMSRGGAEKAEAIAKNMKSGGMSDKLISKYTGLSLAKVKKL